MKKFLVIGAIILVAAGYLFFSSYEGNLFTSFTESQFSEVQ